MNVWYGEWIHERDRRDEADWLTVVVDGVGDDGAERSSALATVVLQEDLNAQPHHVQVVLFRLQQLLVWNWGHTDAQQVSQTHTDAEAQAPVQTHNWQEKKRSWSDTLESTRW